MSLFPILTASVGFWQELADKISLINEKANALVWGLPMLVLFIGAGLYFSFRLGFFQIFRFGHWWEHTISSLFKGKRVRKSRDKKSISQFQALAAALASTIGTGNIVGVATAITAGGAGAIFWMWVSAFFGMMTNFAEKILGIYFRHKNKDGEWTGGAMFYIEKGLGQRWLAMLFSFFCLVASFGTGNMAQINGVAASLESAFSVPSHVTGIVMAILVGLVILGGIKRIAAVSEKLVPLMSIIYFAGVLAVIGANFRLVPAAFAEIFEGAFSLKSAGGGLLGYGVARAARYGIARGVFSNEAGLGSSVMIHSSADVKEPVHQGMWAILEVFFDTIVMCTLTAIAILATGAHNVAAIEGAQITFFAFSTVFGKFGEYIVTISILFFAFCSTIGWSFYGTRAAEYLLGRKVVPIYKLFYVAVVYVGAVSSVRLVWELADTFNGLMALPNLFALFALSGTVFKIVRNYKDRVFRHKNIAPILSYDEQKYRK